MNKAIKTKERILKALGDEREYELSWGEEIFYSVNVKARNKEEAKQKFWDGEVEGTDKDITDCNVLDDTLEIEEV